MNAAKTGLLSRFPELGREDELAQGGSSNRAAVALLGLALFTISWDRFAFIPVGPGIKIAIIFGWVALAVGLWQSRKTPWVVKRWLVVALGAAMIGYLILRGIFTPSIVDAMVDIASMAGKVALAVAVVVVVRNASDVLRLLNWFIAGGILASVVGLYELAAFYTGLPQLIGYVGIGGEGGLGRIASFNYEPAYFGYFLLLVVGAIVAKARFTARPINVVLLLFVLGTLLLVNSRGVYLFLPVVLIAVAAWDRKLLTRRGWWTVLLVAVVGIVAGIALFGKQLATTLGWISSAVNPAESWSNAVRLDLYDSALQVLSGDWLFGVGPGQFYAAALALNGDAGGQSAVNATANNIWLQALLDGGVPMALLQLALFVAVVVAYVIRASAPVRTLALSLLVVVFLSGFLVTSFWDAKVWMLLGIVVAMKRLPMPALTPIVAPVAEPKE